jgi:hypothetical protein
VINNIHTVKIDKELLTDFVPGHHPKAFFEAWFEFKSKYVTTPLVDFIPDVESLCRFGQYRKTSHDVVNMGASLTVVNEHRVEMRFKVKKHGTFAPLTGTFASFHQSLIDNNPFYLSDFHNCEAPARGEWLEHSTGDIEEFTNWFHGMVKALEMRKRIEKGILESLGWNHLAYRFDEGAFDFDPDDRDNACLFLAELKMKEWFLEEKLPYEQIFAEKGANLKELKDLMSYGRGFDRVCDQYNINLKELREKKHGDDHKKGDIGISKRFETLSESPFLSNDFEPKRKVGSSLEDPEFEPDDF